MSPDLLEYGLRVSTIWLLLLSYYFLWGRKTGFRFQRMLLLGGWIFGLAIPLLPALEATTTLPMANLPSISLAPAIATVSTAAEAAPLVNNWQWTDTLPWLYLLGILILGARSLVQSWRVKQCSADGERSSFGGFPVITSSRIKSPFAARGYVFLPEGLDPALTHTALLHETAHLRARHHYDKTLMTLGSILLWFHPLVWAYRRLLATIHEYEADAAVLQTVPARTYGLQLLHCSLGPTGRLGLFSSPLRQRIEMITSTNPKRQIRFLPLSILALLLASLTFACSDVGKNLTPSEEIQLQEVPILQLAPDDTVDDYPRLLNSPFSSIPAEVALSHAIQEELNYPEKALEMGYEGKVRALITINEDGTINTDGSIYMELSGEEEANSPTNIKISVYKPGSTSTLPANVRHSVLVEEVARAIGELGDFQPTTVKGQPTPVMLEIYFSFQIEE